MTQCLECGKELTSKDAKKFCSRSCSAKYNNRKRYLEGFSLSEEQRQRISLAIKDHGKRPNNAGREISEREVRTCPECKSTFRTTVLSLKKYCSKDCGSKHMGGYRNGSGRSKSGYYKGIYCGSTYELCWVIYNLDHNIKFSRFEGCLEKNNIRYYPDFILDDNKTIKETKGYEKHEDVDKKSYVAESFGYTVNVLRKEDLEYAFNYVKETYNTDKFYTLYDGYIPIHEYTCCYCKTVFTRDKKLKTENVYCSRSCSGKQKTRGNKYGVNQYTKNKTL